MVRSARRSTERGSVRRFRRQAQFRRPQLSAAPQLRRTPQRGCPADHEMHSPRGKGFGEAKPDSARTRGDHCYLAGSDLHDFSPRVIAPLGAPSKPVPHRSSASGAGGRPVPGRQLRWRPLLHQGLSAVRSRGRGRHRWCTGRRRIVLPWRGVPSACRTPAPSTVTCTVRSRALVDCRARRGVRW